MSYADYAFYKNTYYGETIPEDAFLRFAERASEKLDAVTFGRLEEKMPQKETAYIKIQKAVCAVADALYQVDLIRKSTMESVGVITNQDGTVKGKMVTSVSSGSESISYGTASGSASSNAYSKAAADAGEEQRLVMSIITGYLAGVTDDNGICLLYAGL